MCEKIREMYKRWRNLIIMGLFVGLCSFLALLMPIILTKPCISPFFYLGEMGSIGDTFNGLSSPFLASIAIVVTFSAFYIQYVANKKQWGYEKKEQFERKFLLLLDLLNKQEAQCKIENVGEAKKAFHYMFYEFKAILFYVVKSNMFEKKEKRRSLELNMAYSFFINGASSSATTRIVTDFKQKTGNSCDVEKVEALNTELLSEQKSSLNSSADHSVFMLRDYRNKKIEYFDGHRCRLISFYRTFSLIINHLYNVDSNATNNEKDSQFFMQTLYSQLSEHEFALMKIIHVLGNEKVGSKENIDSFFSIKSTEELINHYMDCEQEESFFKTIIEESSKKSH